MQKEFYNCIVQGAEILVSVNVMKQLICAFLLKTDINKLKKNIRLLRAYKIGFKS